MRIGAVRYSPTAIALLLAAAIHSGCGDDDAGDASPDAGGQSGQGGSSGSGGSAGSSGSGGSAGAAGSSASPEEIAACVGGHFSGVNTQCAQCMCECNVNASECDENCWKLSNCIYFQCQMTNNQGVSASECAVLYCG